MIGEGARFVRRVLRDDVLAAIQQLVPLAQEENLTMAGIDSALGSFIESDGAMVGTTSPKQRLR